jgi:endoglucanase
LEALCNATAVSGEEGEVRRIILEELKGKADSPQVDAMGNVLVVRSGSGKKRPRVMLSAHMDEVGFVLLTEDGPGLFRFGSVGGIDPRPLPGKPVLVGHSHVPGVISAQPIHLAEPDELKHKTPVEKLRIDIGTQSPRTKPGDRACFATRFQQSGPSILAKALDNRLGVATLIELVKRAPAGIDLLAAFTVQEEIGARGARVAAYSLNPDLAIAVDATPAYDLPSWNGEENSVYNTKLGCGPAIYIGDAGTLADPRLVRWLAAVGEAHDIPYQFRQPGGGGTDAGAIHKARRGIPSISVSIPHRYPHSAVEISRLEDWKNTLALLLAALEEFPSKLLTSERA